VREEYEETDWRDLSDSDEDEPRVQSPRNHAVSPWKRNSLVILLLVSFLTIFQHHHKYDNSQQQLPYTQSCQHVTCFFHAYLAEGLLQRHHTRLQSTVGAALCDQASVAPVLPGSPTGCSARRRARGRTPASRSG
jgi:hypothetical protein